MTGNMKVQYYHGTPARDGKGSVGGGPNNVSLTTAAAISNPFSPHAKGAKLPDSDASRSVPIQVKQVFYRTSDVNGRMSFEIIPSLKECLLASTADTGSVATMAALSAGSSVTDYSAIEAGVDKYRIVSMGVRIYSLASPTDQSGTITFITLSETIAGADIDYSGSMYEAIERYPVAQSNIHWISKPVGNEWLNYREIDSDSMPYETLFVSARGLTISAQNMAVEVVFNVECQTKISSISSLMATPAADHKPNALAAGSNVHNQRSGSYNGSTTSLTSRLWGLAKGALADLAADAIPYVGKAVGRLITSGGSRKNRRKQLANQQQLMLTNG